MGTDEAGTLRRLTDLRQDFLEPLIDEHHGRVVKLMGDGLLVEFASVVDAVACALAWQDGVAKREAAAEEDSDNDRRLRFRIGINLGDVIVEGDDIHGDGVNIAARLESLAEPGGICLSGDAYRQARGKIEVEVEDMGEQDLKNVAEPVWVYRIVDDSSDTAGAAPARMPLALPDKPSIAVLPFTNMSGDPEQEYFSDGITEDIITALSRFRSLFVIARNSSFTYKGRAVKVRDIGHELGARYIVEGSVRRAGGRVRVTAQLVEAENGNHLWGEHYDRDLEDIFAVQDEVTQAIVAALPGRLDDAAMKQSRRKPTNSLTAYDCLLRAEWSFWRNEDEKDVLAYLYKAIEVDPQCARAYSLIGVIRGYGVFAHGVADPNSAAESLAFAEQALATDDHDALIHARASFAYLFRGQHERALYHSERAVELNPNDAEVMYRRGTILAFCGDPEAGLEWQLKSMRLDPFYPEHHLEPLIESHYMTRQYGRAIEAYQRYRNPRPHIHVEAAASYAQLGRMDDAQAAVARFERARPSGYQFGSYLEAHLSLLSRPEDREHWLDGYRKVGLTE
jgi:adenylate cyclase